ncbi:MAG: hypothetical protein CSA65_09285 [Proteobacteria bacterium]|nr:MAG: hypothetical protein CSA65_09285 [Pseudomonadota bacterium]
MAKAPARKWTFRARFRRHAYGWKSQPAIKRIKEAVSEIKQEARQDPLLAAEGAVLFLEKVSPAIEQVDSSSGAIGTAVNNAIAALVEIIAAAPADEDTRTKWLERLWEAYQDDDIPYLESLGDHWGALCARPEVASHWADELIETCKMAWSPDPELRGYFKGTTNCLSALVAAGRHDARACEEVLLSSGLADEAYEKYGLVANQVGTYLAWFCAVAKKYPHKPKAEVLADLVAHTPGDEGKWFAAAKSAKLFDEAIELANRTPCAPQTLTRAARDFEEKNPTFALEAGMAALRWLVEGYGYEITGADVLAAYSHTMKAAEHAGIVEETRARIRDLVSRETFGERFVSRILGRYLELR